MRLSLRDVLERPGPVLADDIDLWDSALMSELASKAARACVTNPESFPLKKSFPFLNETRRMRGEIA